MTKTKKTPGPKPALKKLSGADASAIAQAVERYNRCVALVVRFNALIDAESPDAPPGPILAYYVREEWSLETLIAELLRHYRSKGAAWGDLKLATGFTMADVKELVNGSGNAKQV